MDKQRHQRLRNTMGQSNLFADELELMRQLEEARAELLDLRQAKEEAEKYRDAMARFAEETREALKERDALRAVVEQARPFDLCEDSIGLLKQLEDAKAALQRTEADLGLSTERNGLLVKRVETLKVELARVPCDDCLRPHLIESLSSDVGRLKAENERLAAGSKPDTMVAELLKERDEERAKHIASHLRLTREIERLRGLNDSLVDELAEAKGGKHAKVRHGTDGALLPADGQQEGTGDEAPQGKGARRARKGQAR